MNSGRGEFFCPVCKGSSTYLKKTVRRFFTLYFIPLIPLDRVGQFVECSSCRGTFKLEVLDYDPEAAIEFEAAFQTAIRRVMVLMMLADGFIDDDEIVVIQKLSANIGGGFLSEPDVRMEIKAAEREGASVTDYISGLIGSINDRDKELIVKAAYLVAHADGEYHPTEQALIKEIGRALELSARQLKRILELAPTSVS